LHIVTEFLHGDPDLNLDECFISEKLMAIWKFSKKKNCHIVKCLLSTMLSKQGAVLFI
jgi:hypothetical protein